MNLQTPYKAVSPQVIQAEYFAKENAERIAQLSESLLNAASLFMDKLGQQHLPAKVTEALWRYHGEKDLASFQILLRQHPISDCGPVSRFAYWELNDGLSALIDALGCHWRYETMVRRSASLGFVDQALACFAFLISNLESDPSTVLSFSAE